MRHVQLKVCYLGGSWVDDLSDAVRSFQGLETIQFCEDACNGHGCGGVGSYGYLEEIVEIEVGSHVKLLAVLQWFEM